MEGGRQPSPGQLVHGNSEIKGTPLHMFGSKIKEGGVPPVTPVPPSHDRLALSLCFKMNSIAFLSPVLQILLRLIA